MRKSFISFALQGNEMAGYQINDKTHSLHDAALNVVHETMRIQCCVMQCMQNNIQNIKKYKKNIKKK